MHVCVRESNSVPAHVCICMYYSATEYSFDDIYWQSVFKQRVQSVDDAVTVLNFDEGDFR